MTFKLSTRGRTVFALSLVAGLLGLTLSLNPGVASAVTGGNGEATFTKWLVNGTGGMVGVVGGEVREGTYAGQILSFADDGTTTAIVADYHINGGRHSFTATVNVTQSDATGIATITGVVTSGWLTGAQVTGGYRTQAKCDMATPGNVLGTVCFKGTLHVDAASAP
jgi:predicted TIM-barrel enzyme